jgi:hypothetical protein
MPITAAISIKRLRARVHAKRHAAELAGVIDRLRTFGPVTEPEFLHIGERLQEIVASAERQRVDISALLSEA